MKHTIILLLVALSISFLGFAQSRKSYPGKHIPPHMVERTKAAKAVAIKVATTPTQKPTTTMANIKSKQITLLLK